MIRGDHDDRQATSPSSAPSAGELFGRYQHIAQVGVGGMGSVHRVKDKVLLRDVALKMLDPSQAGRPRKARRFLHEAQVTSQLDHPNIVPVHDLASAGAGDRRYYTMKLVTGTTLADWIDAADRPESSPEILYDMLGAFLKVCDAVAFAHSRGVIHCDLKPSNIMVGDFGEVYVMDWGLARLRRASPKAVLVSGRPVTRRKGRLIGTPAFMAPEQIAGAHEKLGPRTDVFGLGAVLFAILAGTAPFDGGSSEETLERARACRIRFPVQGSYLMPPRLCLIAKKAMAKNPARRYPTVLALKRELEAFVKGGFQLPVRTYPPRARILTEGERGDEAFILEKGTCVVSKRVGAVQRRLRHMGVGAVFGETAALAGGVRTATVDAVDQVTVRVVSKKILEEHLGLDSWIGAFAVALARRFRAADQRLSKLESQDG